MDKIAYTIFACDLDKILTARTSQYWHVVAMHISTGKDSFLLFYTVAKLYMRCSRGLIDDHSIRKSQAKFLSQSIYHCGWNNDLAMSGWRTRVEVGQRWWPEMDGRCACPTGVEPGKKRECLGHCTNSIAPKGGDRAEHLLATATAVSHVTVGEY